MLKRSEVFLAIICLLVVGMLVLVSIQSNDRTTEREFRVLASEASNSLDVRIQTYLQSLQATLAYLDNDEEVTPEEFEQFVENLQIAEYLPGINGIGFITPVAREDSAAFEERQQAKGYQDFQIKPDTNSEVRFVIQHIFPVAPNIQARGLDITFEEGRRTAATTARDSGEARLTPRITLVQDAMQKAGFLLLLPFFDQPAGSLTNTQDRSQFRGWVYAPFVGDNLLHDLTSALGQDFHLQVYDGTDPSPETAIYDSGLTPAEFGAHSAEFLSEKFGRTWTLRFTSTPAFDRSFSTYAPWAIIAVGLFVTLILVTLVRNVRLRGEASRELAALREKQINAQEEENRSIADNTVTPVFILDSENRVVFANLAASMCFEFSEEELKRRPFSGLVRQTAISSRSGRQNAEGLTKSGRKLALDVDSNAWRTADDKDRVTVLVRDITAEVAAIEQIQRTKALYDRALQGSRIGIFEVDLQTGKSEVSSTWADIMEVSDRGPGFNSQKIFLSRIHPDDLPILQAEDAKCIIGETDRSVAEYRMRFGAHSWRWMRSDAIVSDRAADGTALRLIGTQTDVTDLRHARFALESSEKQLRQVVTAAPIGMIVLDENGKFLRVNDAFCKLCGASEEQLLNTNMLTDFMNIEDVKTIRRKISEMVEEGTGDIYVNDHRVQHISGEERWGAFHISWTFDRNTNRFNYIAQIIDVTEQKRVDELKNEFVSTVSHELRTPLTSIKGALGLLEAGARDTLSDQHKRLVHIATSNTERLTNIVNDILDLEKISSGEVSFEFATVDLNELVQDTITELAPFAMNHNNVLKTRLPEDSVCVRADARRLKQVIVNLTSNACKFSDADTDVTLIVETIEDDAIFYIQNYGPGVPEKFKEHMFKAFSQADSSDTRKKGGTGLGLNISRQIIERHNGRIGFESRKDGETVFWFTCPLCTDDRAQKPEVAPLTPEQNSWCPRVLHIEEDRDFAEIVASGFSSQVDITLARTLPMARQAIALESFDAVIFDWSAVDRDSGDLINDILKRQPDIRLISLSADADRRSDPRIAVSFVKSRADAKELLRVLTEAKPSGPEALVS